MAAKIRIPRQMTRGTNEAYGKDWWLKLHPRFFELCHHGEFLVSMRESRANEDDLRDYMKQYLDITNPEAIEVFWKMEAKIGPPVSRADHLKSREI